MPSGSGLNDAAMTVAANALKGVLLYAQIHTGPAGATGQAHLSMAPREPITWGTVTGSGDFNIASDLNFTGGELGGPVYSITLWSADRGGTTGSSGVGGTASSTPLSWVDTIPSGTTYAVVWVSHFPSSSSPGTAVTIGGSSCTQAPGSPFVYQTDGGYYYTLECFVLANPPIGASKTVSVTKTSGGSGFNAEAVYYQSVDSVGTMIPTNGDPTTHPSISVANSSTAIIYSNAFTYRSTGSHTFSAYNQNQRYLATAGSYVEPLIVGDAYGNGGNLTFSATRSDTSYKWGGAVLPLTASGGTFYGEFVLSGDNAFNNAGAYSVSALSFDGSAS